MIALCIVCAVWLIAVWPLFPQISRFYPQAPAELLLGLAGMGLATVLALGSLTRAAFALRALSVASPKQEALPLSWDQQERQMAQRAGTPHLEHPTTSASPGRASSVPKGWIGVLAVLLLVFILPWPLLDTANSPPFEVFLGNWFLAGVVGIITASLVTIRSRRSRFWRTLQVWGSVVPVVLYILMLMLSMLGIFLVPSFWVYWLLAIWVSIIPAQFVRGRSGTAQADRATQQPRNGLSPRTQAVVVLLVWFAFSLQWLLGLVFGHPPVFAYGIAGLIIFSCIYMTPALVVKVYNRNEQADRAAQKPRNRLSPRVWIMVIPVLFLVFCMQFEFIVVPDYPNFGEVLIAWLTTGLAGLIILLAVKIGSRASTDLLAQEALQQVQVQG